MKYVNDAVTYATALYQFPVNKDNIGCYLRLHFTTAISPGRSITRRILLRLRDINVTTTLLELFHHM